LESWIRGGLAADPAQLVVSGQEPPDVGGQFVAADRDWCGGGLQRVLHDGLVPAGDEQDAEGGCVDLGSYLGVDCLDVELQLAEGAWVEPADLELEGDVAVQAGVVTEQVDEELAVSDDEWVLLANDREAGAELEQQLSQFGE